MVKIIVDIYDNNYKNIFLDNVTLQQIDNSLDCSYFFI